MWNTVVMILVIGATVDVVAVLVLSVIIIRNRFKKRQTHFSRICQLELLLKDVNEENDMLKKDIEKLKY